MPFSRFVVAAPGSLASQRIAKLERENAELKNQVEQLRKRADEAEAWFQLADAINQRQARVVRLE